MTDRLPDNAEEAELRLTAAARAVLDESVDTYRIRLLRQASAQISEGPIPAADIAALSRNEGLFTGATRLLLDEALQDRRESLTARRTSLLMVLVIAASTIAAFALAYLAVETSSSISSIAGLTGAVTAIFSVTVAYLVSLNANRQSRVAARRAREAEYALDRIMSAQTTTVDDSPPDAGAWANAKFISDWRRLESLIRKLGDRLTPPPSGRTRPLGSTLALLSDSKTLSPELVEDIKQLLRLRNEVVHGGEDTRFVSASRENLDHLSSAISLISDVLQKGMVATSPNDGGA